MIHVVKAPPYLTVQDRGRTRHRAVGVPLAGAMDVLSADMVNVAVGNACDAALLEWAIAGGTLRFDAPTTIALGGASVIATVDGRTIAAGHAIAVAAGAELHIERFVRGRFLYVAVVGGIDVPLVLGSRSTLLTAGFGGFEGRRLRRDDVIPVGHISTTVADVPNVVRAPGVVSLDTSIRIVRGPQADLFDDAAWAQLCSGAYIIAHASDRMGYRLDGPTLTHRGHAALPSEPTCLGAIQVPDGGTPIVLLNDGPTVGGYPKMAVVVRADLGAFVQRMPGDRIRFTLVGD